eukprot:767365-Hanusia_phi.AAC.2
MCKHQDRETHQEYERCTLSHCGQPAGREPPGRFVRPCRRSSHKTFPAAPVEFRYVTGVTFMATSLMGGARRTSARRGTRREQDCGRS